MLHYDDEVGHGNFEAVSAAFAATGAPRPAGVALKRGVRLDGATVTALMKDSPHHLLVTTQFGTVSDLLRAASQAGTPRSVAALSFVNPDELSESSGALARGVVVSQTMPSPRRSNQVSIPIARQMWRSVADGRPRSWLAPNPLDAAIDHPGTHQTV